MVAPAGSGKTVLLEQWTATHPDISFVWLSLDTLDDDPVRFSQRFLSGLSAIDPDVGELAPLVSMNGGGLGAPLLEALESQMADFPEVVLVFDDLHQLSNESLIGDLGKLVDLLPPQVHMVMSSRVDPPMAWARHRLRANMSEFRQSDLALDGAESAELLERISGRSVGADSVDALVARTEGWAAGLQLAGVTLRDHCDAEAFVAQFSGDDRLVADYLSQEVLESQSATRRRLLLEMSVLDAICADLVRAVTGEDNAQVVLEQLERESMFLVALDTRREWFRFHHLFRDLLRFRLTGEDPQSEKRLLKAAAAWSFANGRVESGVEYLLRAKDWEGALDVIVHQRSGVFERGETATVIRWIRQIPESARADHTDVNLLLGALLTIEGQTTQAGDILRRVSIDPDATKGERVCAQCFLAAHTQWRPRPEYAISVATEALEMLEDLGDEPLPQILGISDRPSLETLAVTSLGRSYFLVGDFEGARHWLERSLEWSGSTYFVWRVHSLGSLALLDAWCGRTRQAEQLADEALALARDVGLSTHPAGADAYFALTLAAVRARRAAPRRALGAGGQHQSRGQSPLATALGRPLRASHARGRRGARRGGHCHHHGGEQRVVVATAARRGRPDASTARSAPARRWIRYTGTAHGGRFAVTLAVADRRARRGMPGALTPRSGPQAPRRASGHLAGPSTAHSGQAAIARGLAGRDRARNEPRRRNDPRGDGDR